MVMVLVFVFQRRKDIHRKEIGLSVIGLVIGTVVGAIGLWLIPPSAARPVFGLLILAAVAASLFAPPIKLTPLNLLLASTVSGVSGTMVGLHGPPMGLVYQNEPPPRTRLMLSTFFIPATIIAVIALAILGRFGWRDSATAISRRRCWVFVARFVARYLDRRRTIRHSRHSCARRRAPVVLKRNRRYCRFVLGFSPILSFALTTTSR